MLRAVVRFARDVAQLPSFPRETPKHVHATGAATTAIDVDEDDDELVSSVLKIVSTDGVPGEALPRSETTWLALAPFEDMGSKTLSTETKTERVRVRRAFVELLVRLAESGRFRWDAATMHCGEMVGPERSSTTSNAFWIDLLRALWPAAARDAEHPLERHLIALSQARRPRFLLCLDQDVAKVDVFTPLEQFLLSLDDDSDNNEDAEPVLFGPTIVDGLPDDDDTWDAGVDVEVGLSFTRGRFSQAAMTQLLDVIGRVHANRDGAGARFRVTTLRFGRACSFQAKALELLGQHRRQAPNGVHSIRLGNLRDVRVPIKRVFFTDLLRGHAILKRLSASSTDAFVSLAAAVRSGGAAHLQELDVRFVPTLENAAWLAFALFHADSRSSVSSLCLRVPAATTNGDASLLSLEWLATFTRVLQSVRAERDLAHMEGGTGLPQGQLLSRTFVRLQPDVVVKTGPSKGSKTLCNLGDTTHQEFELLVRYNSALAVVVPGVGIGWAPSMAIVSERVTPSRLSNEHGGAWIPINQQITSFTWDACMPRGMGYHHLQVLLEVLAIIGGPLRRLHLPALPLGSEHLAQILLYCPNLTELNISGHQLEDIAPLAEAYETGQCKIASLSIARATYKPLGEGHLIDTMATILEGNGRHVLRQLVVHALPPRLAFPALSFVWEKLVVPLVKAVSACPHLEYLHLPGLNLFANGAPQRLPVDFSAQPLSFSPMPLRSKLALLSVISRYGHERSLGRLDASVLGVIFRFSYNSVARRVLKDAPIGIHDGCHCGRCPV